MTIEVRQLVIKSTVDSSAEGSLSEQQIAHELEALREQLMIECRELVVESIRENSER